MVRALLIEAMLVMDFIKSFNDEMNRILWGLKHGFCTTSTLETSCALLANLMFIT
jgi:hypothetical protein